jgi:hypothetical protein
LQRLGLTRLAFSYSFFLGDKIHGQRKQEKKQESFHAKDFN